MAATLTLPKGLRTAFCPGAGPADNSCSPANKGDAEEIFNLSDRLHDKYGIVIESAGEADDTDTQRIGTQIETESQRMGEDFSLIEKLQAQESAGHDYRVAALPICGVSVFASEEQHTAESGSPAAYNPNTAEIAMLADNKSVDYENRLPFSLGNMNVAGQGDNNTDEYRVDSFGIFRHEYGHHVWYQGLDQASRQEFQDLWIKNMGDYSRVPAHETEYIVEHGGDAWKFSQKLSEYGTISVTEGWAEAFNAITHPDYGAGGQRMPDDIEKFMYQVLGKRGLPSGLKMAFCPGAGAEDNSCPPANKGASQEKDSKGARATKELKAKLQKKVEEITAAIAYTKSEEYLKTHGVSDISIGTGIRERSLAGLEVSLAYAKQSLDKIDATPPVLTYDKEKLDKLVEDLRGQITANPDAHSFDDLEWSDISQDAQTAAWESYSEDHQTEAMVSAWGSVEEDMVKEIEDTQDKKDYTLEVLQLYNDEFGIDPSTFDLIVKSNGEIDPYYIAFRDGSHGAEAEGKWSELKDRWDEVYKEQYSEDKKTALDEMKEDDKWREMAIESADENISIDFNNLDNSELLSLIDDSDKQSALESKYGEDVISSETIPTVTPPAPGNWSCIDDNKGDFEETKTVLKAIQGERSREIAVERGLNPNEMGRVTNEVWSKWKGDSQNSYSKLVQLACADEFGSLGKPEYELDRANVIESGGGKAEYDLVRAHLRATWEATQYGLEQEGKTEVNTWRAIFVPSAELGSTKREANNKLPDIEILRNGAQSTSGSYETPNSWQGIGSTTNQGRVVLRVQLDPTAALSVPAFGQNVHSEKEIVVLGRGWKKWDAWYDKAPQEPIGITEGAYAVSI